MIVQQQIQRKLIEACQPAHLDVINESSNHSVPPNSETHFKVVVVSDVFENVRQVARHQKIYQILSDEIAEGVHALAIHTFTPEEWKLKGAAPESPNCLGGSKAS